MCRERKDVRSRGVMSHLVRIGRPMTQNPWASFRAEDQGP